MPVVWFLGAWCGSSVPGTEPTRLTMTMDAKPRKWLAKVFVWLIQSMIKRAVDKDMDLVKVYCERKAGKAT